MKTLISFSLLALVMATSCTITKRVHQKGYSVQWNGHYGQQPKNVLHQDEIAETTNTNETEEIRTALSLDETVNSENQVDAVVSEIENAKEQIRTVQTTVTVASQSNSFKTANTFINNTVKKALPHLSTQFRKTNIVVPIDAVEQGKKAAKNSQSLGTAAVLFLVLGFLFIFFTIGVGVVMLLVAFITAASAIVSANRSKKLGATDPESLRRQKIGRITGKTVLVLLLLTAFLSIFLYITGVLVL